MKKILAAQIGSVVLVMGLVCLVIHFFLLSDQFLHLSIDSLPHGFTYQSNRIHLLMIALLPIYIGVFIFGTAFLGIYLTRKWCDPINKA